MPIYRGVSGVNRQIKRQYRGVSGVNREIKEQWRGVGGTNRRVFRRHSIEQRLLNLGNLVGSYEINDFGTYLWARINGRHINGDINNTRVACGWQVKDLKPGDIAKFTYEFTATPPGVGFFDLTADGGATLQTVGINSSSGDVTVDVVGNNAVLQVDCGSGTAANKTLKITKITLNSEQIYPY